ncbi:hypothetical protein SAMN05660690_2126, partial [Geodermatophilus telluris]
MGSGTPGDRTSEVVPRGADRWDSAQGVAVPVAVTSVAVASVVVVGAAVVVVGA